MRRILYQTCQINWYRKKLKLFFQKTPPAFPRKSEVWKFWEFLRKGTIWDAFWRNIASNSNFQKVSAVFSNYPSSFLEFSSCWTFSVLLSYDTFWYFLKGKLEEKCHVYRLWKNRIFQKQHIFLRKTQKFDCFENSKSLSKSDRRSFSSIENIYFFHRNPNFERFESS